MGNCLVLNLTETVADNSLRKLTEMKIGVTLVDAGVTNRAGICVRSVSGGTYNFRSANGLVSFYSVASGGTAASTFSLVTTGNTDNNFVYISATGNDTIFLDFVTSANIYGLKLTNAFTTLNSKLSLNAEDFNLSILDTFYCDNTKGGCQYVGDADKIINAMLAKTRYEGVFNVPYNTLITNLTIAKVFSVAKAGANIYLNNSSVTGDTSAVSSANKSTGAREVVISFTAITGNCMNLVDSAFTGILHIPPGMTVNFSSLPLGISTLVSYATTVTCASTAVVFTGVNIVQIIPASGISKAVAINILTCLSNSTFAGATKTVTMNIIGYVAGMDTDIDNLKTAILAKGATAVNLYKI